MFLGRSHIPLALLLKISLFMILLCLKVVDIEFSLVKEFLSLEVDPKGLFVSVLIPIVSILFGYEIGLRKA